MEAVSKRPTAYPDSRGTRDGASLLTWGRAALAPSETASLDAQLLLAHALGKDRSWVLAHDGEPVSASAAETFRWLIERRAEGEPVAYLRGYVDWFGMTLRVGPEVLVPRPETELLAEEAIRIARERAFTSLADVGTGSGCIAIALARFIPAARIVATDVGEGALSVARENCSLGGVLGRVDLRLGYLAEPLTSPPELLTANLPYLSDEMMRTLPSDVRREPSAALHGGPTGLELYCELLRELRERGWEPVLLFEIDPRQSATAIEMVSAEGSRDDVRPAKDYSGRNRIVVVGA